MNYQLNQLNNQIINKYFYIHKNPCKITRTTDKTIFYKCCILDNEINVDNGEIFNFRNNTYYHFSNIISNEPGEGSILKTKFIKNDYVLLDEINLDKYNYNETGYFNSLFFKDIPLLKRIYKLKYEVQSFSVLIKKMEIYETSIHPIEIKFKNNCIGHLVDTKRNIFDMIKNDETIIEEMLKYFNYLKADDINLIIIEIKAQFKKNYHN